MWHTLPDACAVPRQPVTSKIEKIIIWLQDED